METIGELVGGCCDGVRLNPSDPTEPDDWPDFIEMEAPGGTRDQYERRVGLDGVQALPSTVNGKRVYYFDVRT